MSKEKPVQSQSLADVLDQVKAFLARYKVMLFVLLIATVYGFVCYQVYSLSNQTDPSDIQNELTSLNPRIDESVAKRLKSLQDNSVNVRTLFVDARNNPFTEQ